ncbi:MAG: flagellar hook-basal body complex protein FliE [Treponemataceae bacterium]|nr:flagellar hook-basal body complex protein FliE [Treponemataceae bacterium]
MLRTDPAHIGSSAIQPVGKVTRVGGVTEVQNPFSNKPSKDVSVEKPFSSYLSEALQYVNGKQNASSDIAEKFIVDPESVNVHEVTTAMAEASLSLSLAQKVIDGMLKDWNEITITR